MNSFNDILARMRSSVSGGISTLEGSFAGDILQAAACELARIYSQEIDTLRERAFVSTAGGEWLDAACADFGVDRKDGESDDSLRARTLSRVRMQASSGNEAHYRAWALEVAGVAGASVQGRLRGPGTVDIFIKPADEQAGQPLLDEVSRYIEGLRPVCVDVNVAFAQALPVDICASLTLSQGATLQSITAQFEKALDSYLAERALTEQGKVLSLAKIAGMIIDCAGVLDAENVTLMGSPQSLAIEAGKYAIPGLVIFDLAV